MSRKTAIRFEKTKSYTANRPGIKKFNLSSIRDASYRDLAITIGSISEQNAAAFEPRISTYGSYAIINLARLTLLISYIDPQLNQPETCSTLFTLARLIGSYHKSCYGNWNLTVIHNQEAF